MVGTRGGYEFEAEDHDDQALERAGRALLGGVKGKDQALRLLKVGGGLQGLLRALVTMCIPSATDRRARPARRAPARASPRRPSPPRAPGAPPAT